MNLLEYYNYLHWFKIINVILYPNYTINNNYYDKIDSPIPSPVPTYKMWLN